MATNILQLPLIYSEIRHRLRKNTPLQRGKEQKCFQCYNTPCAFTCDCQRKRSMSIWICWGTNLLSEWWVSEMYCRLGLPAPPCRAPQSSCFLYLVFLEALLCLSDLFLLFCLGHNWYGEVVCKIRKKKFLIKVERSCL